MCEATKDDWAGDKMLVEKLNRNFRVWQLEITDEKNALIPQVLRLSLIHIFLLERIADGLHFGP